MADKKEFIELRREARENEITIFGQDGSEWDVDLTETHLTSRYVKNAYGILLEEFNLEQMLDALWNFGIVTYWPPKPGEKYGTWEVW
jgi:hypothetical protein